MSKVVWQHAGIDRRCALQAGAIGLLGLGSNHLAGLREASAAPIDNRRRAIYIFLSGGLAQHDSFDMKPDAPENIRGEFRPIATNTPGLDICEHLPMLARRSHLWSLVRSLTHTTQDHRLGHHIMLTGRSGAPPAFNGSKPQITDYPAIASMATALMPQRNNLPPAVVLPEKMIHYSGQVIPGQFAGMMGHQRDPWFIEASPYDPASYGAYPEYGFDHQDRPHQQAKRYFQAPSLTLPQNVSFQRLGGRLDLMKLVDHQRQALDSVANVESFDRYRQVVISLMTDSKVRDAFDVTNADQSIQERYGRNSFGWSLLMARRLVDAGVSLVQVNLGNNETWDTHGEAFPHLKDQLFPPFDRSLSALLDDLESNGQLKDTLIVIAGEFGRTPKVTHLPQHYKLPGRDHWGASQTVFFAGGGTKGGTVIGSTDKIGAYPVSETQTPENMAATIYESLGIPESTMWTDELGRPHHVYFGEPIKGLV